MHDYAQVTEVGEAFVRVGADGNYRTLLLSSKMVPQLSSNGRELLSWAVG